MEEDLGVVVVWGSYTQVRCGEGLGAEAVHRVWCRSVGFVHRGRLRCYVGIPRGVAVQCRQLRYGVGTPVEVV